MQMARQRESDSEKKAVRTIAEMMSRQCKESPSSGTRALFGMAQDNIDALKPKMELAKAFIAEARERRSRGELDDKTLSAEIAPVNVSLALFSTLKIMLERAKDKNALQTLAWASGTLSQSIQEGGSVLSKRAYPDDPVLKGHMVESRKSSAVKLHDSVMSEKVLSLATELEINLLPVNLMINSC